MGRELKFRAWDSYREKMVLQNQEIRDGHSFAGVAWGSALTVNEEGIAMQDSVLEVMQYTGLKDKNGKEIYEGDMVRSVDGYPCIVGYDTTKAEYDPFGSGEFSEWGEGVEVIGNIYENPLLLKGENRYE